MGIQLNGTSGTDVISAVDGSLTIDGDISVVDKIIHGGDTNTAIRFPAADTVTVETGGGERFRIDSTGKIGVGVNPTAYPGKFVVSGDALICDRDIHSRVANSVDNSDRGFKQDIDGVEKLHLYTDNTNNIILEGNGGAEKLRINNGGSVGIGTVSPSVKLHVYDGSIRSSNTGNTNFTELGSDGNIEIKRTGGSAYIDFADATGNDADCRIQHVSDGFEFSTGGQGSRVTRLRIDSNGFIKQKFTSNNSTVAEGLFINNMNNGTGNNASLIFSNDSGERKKASISYIDTGNYGTGDMVFCLDNDADSGELHVTNHERMRITSTGKIGVGLAPNAWQASTTSKLIQIGNGSVWDYNLQQFDLGQNFYYDGSNYKYIANGYATKLAQLKSSGDFVFYQSSISGTGGNNLTWYEKLRLNWGTSGHNGTVDVKGIPAHLRLNSLRDTSDWDATDPIGKLDFYVGSDTSNNLPYAAGFIHCLNETNNTGEPSGALVFGSSTANASGGAVERLRISSSGYMQMKNSAGSTFALLRNNAVADSTSLLGSIDFGTIDWDSSTAAIKSYHDGAKDNASLRLYTQPNVGSGVQERLRITSSGQVNIAYTGANDDTPTGLYVNSIGRFNNWVIGNIPGTSNNSTGCILLHRMDGNTVGGHVGGMLVINSYTGQSTLFFDVNAYYSTDAVSGNATKHSSSSASTLKLVTVELDDGSDYMAIKKDGGGTGTASMNAYFSTNIHSNGGVREINSGYTVTATHATW